MLTKAVWTIYPIAAALNHKDMRSWRVTETVVYLFLSNQRQAKNCEQCARPMSTKTNYYPAFVSNCIIYF